MSGGLSSLEALKQKLAEDQARITSGVKPFNLKSSLNSTRKRLAEDTRRYQASPCSAASPDSELPTGLPNGSAKSAQPQPRAVSVMTLGSEDDRYTPLEADWEASAVAARAVHAAMGDTPEPFRGGSPRQLETPPVAMCREVRSTPGSLISPASKRQGTSPIPERRVTVSPEAKPWAPRPPSTPQPSRRQRPGSEQHARQARPDSKATRQDSVMSITSVTSPGADGLFDFDSDPANFAHILRFMRDGEGWEPPQDLKVRAALKREAMYFGCHRMLDRLDKDDVVRSGIDCTSDW